ncbi:transcriptional regulator [Haemophilus paracuniculus]|uniref:Transcriptional regulator n=1 Tax=Haemophilus paracuniculus TaxID=734 RepID=A0A1T0AR58_9PAST|nr:helix-turn-helix transcriptional regulator [Haemophilus paracuniculus]OOR98764.1 transcriptional regulator [Haemophilus paracuniculus]
MQDKNAKIMQTIGRAIAKYRQAVGLTQAELAEILGIGNDAVSRMERGTTVPTVLRLVELAEIFQCEVADLLTESSTRSLDQARRLEGLLQGLNISERIECVDLVERMIKWKKSEKNLRSPLAFSKNLK